MASRSHDLRKTVEQVTFSTTGELLSVKAEVDSLYTVKQMVTIGLGHTVLPLSAIRKELADGTLKARRIVHPVIERHAAMAFVSRRPKTRAQQAIAALILNIARRSMVSGHWVGRSMLPSATNARATKFKAQARTPK